MKTIFTTFGLLVAFSVSVVAQGTAMRATNGTAYGGTLLGATRIGTGGLGTNFASTPQFQVMILGITTNLTISGGDNNAIFTIGPGLGGGGAINIFELQQDGLIMYPNRVIYGDGSGLTNLNTGSFPPSVTVTNVFNFSGKTTFLSTSYPTNKWDGPTNALLLVTNYVNFVASTDCAITNVGGQVSTVNSWATLTISNSTASDITVRTYANGPRAQGSGTTFALVVGAGKEGILSFLSRGLLTTNFVTTTQQ